MKEFNKTLMFENINHLLKESGKKIGELENECGVSAGYISRTSKEGNAKPGIDFIFNVAQALKVSMDTLLKEHLNDLTPTEKYLISFIEKLYSDTLADKLDWESESADYLNNLEPDFNGNVGHPLYDVKTFYEESECEYPEEVTKPIFESRSFGYNTYVNGTCYYIKLKNNSTLYLMNISKNIYHGNDEDISAKEMWLYAPREGRAQYLCNDKGDSIITDLLNNLYEVVEQRQKHPKIKKSFKTIIDAFMEDDFEDDEFDETIPF